MALNFVEEGLFQRQRPGRLEDRERVEPAQDFLGNPALRAQIIVAKDGSGDTDDIAEAMKLVDVNGSEIYIKAGTYLISSEIVIPQSNITISGNGYNTILQADTQINIFAATSKNNITIQNLKLVSNHDSNGHTKGCINFNGVTDSRILNCFIDFGESGVLLENSCENIAVLYCNFDGRASAESAVWISSSSFNFIAFNFLSNINDYFVNLSAGDKNIIVGNAGKAGAVFAHLDTGDLNTFVANVCEPGGAWGDEIQIKNDSDNNLVVGNVFPNDGYAIIDATGDANLVVANLAAESDDSGTNTEKGHNQT